MKISVRKDTNKYLSWWHFPKKIISGFTLIELLAVIIILGILMIIAIPSVTEYIANSRKNAYVDTVHSYINAARNIVNSGEIPFYDKKATYYIPGSCVSMENGGKNTPYGEFLDNYVVVTYDGNGYDYYYTGRDSANHGIVLTHGGLLSDEYIDTNLEKIEFDVGVGNRETIIKYTDSCNKNEYEEIIAKKVIKEKDSLKNGFDKINETTEIDCFEFDSSTGTITGYKCSNELLKTYQVLDVDRCSSKIIDLGFGGTLDEAKLYCSDDPSLEFSISDDLKDNYIPSDVINELLDEKIISETSSMTISDTQNIVIPNSIRGVLVTSIGDYAFYDSNLYTVEIPETVTSIGESAFADNLFLYNIVNKTNRVFDWGDILGYSQNNNANFVTGTTNFENCGGFYVTRITSSKVEYSLDGMFEESSDGYKLLDKKGLDVYYHIGYFHDDDEWIPLNINQNLSCSDLETDVSSENKEFEIERLNTTYNKKYSVKPMSCQGPSHMIKVAKGDTTYFITSFYLWNTCS